MRFNKYSKQDLIDAVVSSISIRQVLLKLNVQPFGGNYAVVKRYIKNLNLNTSHFKGQGWNKGYNFGPKRPLSDYFSNKYPIQSNNLRKRLLLDGVFEHMCYHCNNTIWNNKPIPLELEHKDGNHNNNSLDNLTLLCPNCHAQTSTYRNRIRKTN